MLTSFLSGTRSRDKKAATSVESSSAITYKLDNSGLWFMQATELESTLLDAAVLIGESLDTLNEGKVQIPVTETLAAFGVPLPVPLTGGEAPLNPRFGGSRKRARLAYVFRRRRREDLRGAVPEDYYVTLDQQRRYAKQGAGRGDGEVTAGIGVPITASPTVGIRAEVRRESEMMTATLEDEGADFQDWVEHDVAAVWAGPIGKQELFLVGR